MKYFVLFLILLSFRLPAADLVVVKTKNKALLKRLDEITAPRLLAFPDRDPGAPKMEMMLSKVGKTVSTVKNLEGVIFVITRNGRAELTGYENIKVPPQEVPFNLMTKFSDYYFELLNQLRKMEKGKVAFIEYMARAEVLTLDELKELGVSWLEDPRKEKQQITKARIIRPIPGGIAVEAFLTRIRVLEPIKTPVFSETQDAENFQGRYVIANPKKPEETISK